MSTWTSVLAGAVAAVTVGFALRYIFRNLPPSMLQGAYKACRGGWHEAELNHCSDGLLAVPQQPVNTYTNLAYVAAGFFLAFNLGTLPSFVIALALFYLCIGSAFYHATATWWGNYLDLSGMYATFAAILVFAVTKVTGGGEGLVAVSIFLFAVLGGYLLCWKLKWRLELLIGIIGVLTYAFSAWALVANGDPWWNWGFVRSLIGFGLAFLVWGLDKEWIFPLKGWGHGFWHIFSAAAIGQLFYAIHQIQ